MSLHFRNSFPSLATVLLLTGCASGGTGTEPLSYDPPGSTVMTDKPITPQHRRTIGVAKEGVWITNEFEGGRLNDLFQLDDSTYVGILRPENAPINNSAWYAFKIWADEPTDLRLRLRYEDGSHRYVPKLSRDGEEWVAMDSASFRESPSGDSALIHLSIGPDTLWVAGQELITSSDFQDWTADLAALPFAEKTTIGTSREGRPIEMVEIAANPESDRYVLLISRQHPPEVTGTHAMMAFVDALTADSELARRFREEFRVLVVPVVNPDGVDLGHWRHNTGGVDLNRDWHNFNQPETRAVRDAFLRIAQDPEAQVYFTADFHSTQRDVFYTMAKDLPTEPANFTDAWLNRIRSEFPDYYVNEDPSGLGSPVSKNWFYETFGAPSVTYELGDETERTVIREVARGAANAMMDLLLQAVD